VKYGKRSSEDRRPDGGESTPVLVGGKTGTNLFS